MAYRSGKGSAIGNLPEILIILRGAPGPIGGGGEKFGDFVGGRLG